MVTILVASGIAALCALLRASLRDCPAGRKGGWVRFRPLWERLRHGRVFDYLQFPKAPGALRRYVYNLADLAILAGAVTLLLRKRR